ncbi:MULTISPECIES: transcription termination/antitermination protein NusG [unclassified Candidatus Frackibacter]|uniref:transcription termination/antitermination protein NusG n=1 Tax=unclassified Candidatus Frackibacter TaxID=2648818 RepID=UPI00079B0DFE|nr:MULTISPECIES: transcription termination/antitermination protein NusG [unclassified Candidatus Frackibacter]KXS42231.1 MAG: transcriptional antiterminator NusG [Candidatus Frackibacter sp. T328-2]SDC21685.1 transcription antitermination protein nusG [Candidatus Frackibacter sp. WG11]SEM50148.1 transcription antitermination protein nusG [Candidatus Frackibacter sp. WG12]SFL51599.1 transcription antitermination protein nusG [Candidatus Frackibacter sp. WG13]
MSDEREWYAIHTYSGHENKVKSNLEKRVTTTGMDEKIFDILIPSKDKVKVKDGKKTMSKEKFFPGYVLIEMIMDDDSWYVVRNTPGVIGFASSGTKPVPVTDAEVNSILKQMGVERPQVEIDLEVGDEVRVIDGPFENFVGDIQEIDLDKSKLTVLVSMFGRQTPVELDFHQVEEV